MKLLIFRTDIENRKNVKTLIPLFNGHSSIINWSIDLEDVDKVLKVEAIENLNEEDVVNLVSLNGFSCESLPD